jgi:hypothetical protein
MDARAQMIDYLESNIGRPVQLVYYGGTHPGDARPVKPTRVLQSRFYGICLKTGIEKTYLYEKCYFPAIHGPVSKHETSKEDDTDSEYQNPVLGKTDFGMISARWDKEFNKKAKKQIKFKEMLEHIKNNKLFYFSSILLVVSLILIFI